MLLRPGQRTGQRRGVILLVVLALLTLFTIVGISFVMYAESAARSARLNLISSSGDTAPDMDPNDCLALFLGQLIYDIKDDDSVGVSSSLRGHSLARNMYGWNDPNVDGLGLLNDKPYCGVGRIKTDLLGVGVTDDLLVNYTYFKSAGDTAIRDPERLATRTSPTAAPTANMGVSWAIPYTYPDLNNLFLASVKASDGTVRVPSFHRDWTGTQGGVNAALLASNTAFWSSKTSVPEAPRRTLRPHPQYHTNFPPPR